jgi:hypothetical protein
MEPLINKAQLRSILERGLLTGKWSVMQFNINAREPILPSRDFLEEHSEFMEMNYRDMEAYHRTHHRKPL